MSEPPRSITDSAWYWVQLFCIAGLVALVLMGPKFTHRQAQIERKYQARQRAARQVSGQLPNTPLSAPHQTAITLWPLYAVLAVVIAIAWWNIWRNLRERRRNRPAEAGAGRTDI